MNMKISETQLSGDALLSGSALRKLAESRLSRAPVAATGPSLEILKDRAADQPVRQAAVLVPIIHHGRNLPARDALRVLLTRRAAHLRAHAGQVAFPGGCLEAADSSATEAALREAREEIGLPAENVEILGHLPGFATATGFEIAPVVGLVTPGFELTLNPAEVSDAFEVPFNFVMDPANHSPEKIFWQGRERHFTAIRYKNHYIWGATAHILVTLFERLFREWHESS